ncbi:sensor histidine kinase [Streptomyces sodiiphilus]|uniref:Oxygen sensor histidine kinase NreB n=1 Tax=Streptomyces sodiiphilus TaxID=226217 RepID=A0ABN2P300_9ACTN
MADEYRRWERHSDLVFGALPYLLLGLSVVVSLADSDLDAWGEEHLSTGFWVLTAVVWIGLTFTLPTRGHYRRARGHPLTVLYFIGLLAIAAVLLSRDEAFLLFAATIFLQALVLLSTGWAFVCVACASFVVNTVPGGLPEAEPVALSWYLGTITVQTLVVGWINLLFSKLDELHEQRRKTVSELQTALAENEGLHVQLIAQAREAGVHDERQRMAAEIHDTLAQGLAGIIRQLEAIGAEDAQVLPDETWRRRVVAARNLASESLAEARRSVQALRPEQLETSTLPDAIAALAVQWSDEQSPCAEFTTTGTARAMHGDLEATLYRVVQEALANVAKHARATKARITLSYMEELVMLDVVDDGVGFDPSSAPDSAGRYDGSGLGLVAMRTRLRRVAGTLEVESAPGEGTAVSACVPFIPAHIADGPARTVRESPAAQVTGSR